MEVLVVGNTAYVDDDFCAKAFPGDHVKVVAAQDARRDESSPHASWKELLQHLDQAYEFERVVYLSTYLTPHTETFGDIELLRSVFRACMGRRVQLLYIAGPAGAEGAGHDDDVTAAGGTQTGKGIIARAANDLCRHYATREGIQAKVLRVPFLYTASPALTDPFLVPLFEACSGGSVALQGAADAPFPLLCAEELAVLVHRIFDSWDANFEMLDVADAFGHTAGSSATICCATFRPSKLAGPTRATKRPIRCARPSTAFKCARCLLNAWRRAVPGSYSRCWSASSPNRPSSTCSTIACFTWC